jgi:hypothetical protein
MWIRVEAEPGENIEHACEEAVRIAHILGATIIFKFNDINIFAKSHSDPKTLVLKYFETIERR